MSSRFGQKDALQYWAGIEHNLDYFCAPGVQIETFGKLEFYTDIVNYATYAWCDVLDTKLHKPKDLVHYGMSPFVYAAACIPDQERTRDIIFLPRADLATYLRIEKENELAIRETIANSYNPLVVVFPPDKYRWESILTDIELTVVCDDVFDSNWQFRLAKLLKSSKRVYLPILGSNIFYATHCGTNVYFYDPGKVYAGTTAAYINTYTQSQLSSAYYNLKEYLKGVFNKDEITEEQLALTKFFLSIDKKQSRNDLKASLYYLNLVNNNAGIRRWVFEITENSPLNFEQLNIELEGMLSQTDADAQLERECHRYALVQPSEESMKVLQAL
jgi:hypothetical protein